MFTTVVKLIHQYSHDLPLPMYLNSVLYIMYQRKTMLQQKFVFRFEENNNYFMAFLHELNYYGKHFKLNVSSRLSCEP